MQQSRWIRVTSEHLAEWWDVDQFSGVEEGDIIVDPFTSPHVVVALWPQHDDELFAYEDEAGLLNEQRWASELRARMNLREVEIF